MDPLTIANTIAGSIVALVGLYKSLHAQLGGDQLPSVEELIASADVNYGEIIDTADAELAKLPPAAADPAPAEVTSAAEPQTGPGLHTVVPA